MTKISGKEIEFLAKGNPNAKYIIIVCEFYWAPCVDQFYRIDEFLNTLETD